MQCVAGGARPAACDGFGRRDVMVYGLRDGMVYGLRDGMVYGLAYPV